MRVSETVKSRLPEHIVSNDNYKLFVSILEYYYDHLEEDDQVLSYDLLDFIDVDQIGEDFVINVLDSVAVGAGDVNMEDLTSRLLAKIFRQYILSKGTDLAIKFLFRVLFGVTASVYYPKENVFKLSDGNWVVDTFFRVLDTPTNRNLLFANIGKKITGLHSNATSIIDRISTHKIGTQNIIDIIVENIDGIFSVRDDLMLANESIIKPLYMINEISIDDGGSGYVVEDELSTTDIILHAEVSHVTGGKISNVKIIDGGALITRPSTNPTVTVTSDSGSGADMTVDGYHIIRQTVGKYIDTKGELSGDQRLHDNYLYQNFSYVIRSPLSISKYRRRFETLAHPLGWLFFGNFQIEENVEVGFVDVLPQPTIGFRSRLSTTVPTYRAYKLRYDSSDNLVGTDLWGDVDTETGDPPSDYKLGYVGIESYEFEDIFEETLDDFKGIPISEFIVGGHSEDEEKSKRIDYTDINNSDITTKLILS